MKPKKEMSKAESVAKAYLSNASRTDPNGSYTGVPKNKKDKPTIDQDDM